MSFVNSEQSVQFSGTARNFINFYGDQRGIALATSGSQTIASGAGVLIGIIGLGGQLLSGGGAYVSQSGATIVVVDGVSGVIVNAQSGASNYAANTAGVLYQFNFGLHSGQNLGGFDIQPSNLTGINAIFRSGLVAVCSGGTAGAFGISLIFSKGV